MTAARASFADLLKPGFHDIFMERYKKYPPEFPKIANELTSNRQYEDDSYVSGFGTAPEKVEGVSVTFDDPYQGYDKRYTHTTFGLGFRVTREMYDDDLYGKMRKMPKALANSLMITTEQDVANVLNRGFTSTYAGGDGKELFATDHPLLAGGTEQNELTNVSDFNEDTYEQALIDIAATTDDRALPVKLFPELLIVSQNNAWRAAKLLNSAQAPFDGTSAINPAKGTLSEGYTVNHYLTDTDAWYIKCRDHALNIFWRRKPEFDQDNDVSTQDAIFVGTARWSTGWSEWRGWFGSPGV